MRRLVAVLLLLAACSREKPVAPAGATPAAPSPAPQATTPSAARATYADAIEWFKSTPGFHFVVNDAGIEADGDMARPRIGAERVRFLAGNDEWVAQTQREGVVWYRGGPAAWKPADAPAWAPRLYQLLTLPFDPQKKEGEPQRIGEENGLTHYRFTDANSGNVHDVWVAADGHLARMTIGKDFTLAIASPDRPASVPEVRH